MVYLQIEAPVENLIFGASQSGGVATKLRLTCNATHDIYESIVLDISDDPTIYKLAAVDGIGFDLTVLDPGEYHYEIFDDADNLLVEGLISMSIIDSAEIFYDEEPLCDIIGPIPIIKLEILDEINGEVIPGGYDDKTKAILESVLAIKAAIEEKGEEVGNDPLRTYADHIREIDTASPAKITIKQGGENKGEFTLNQKNDQIIELEDGGEPHWFGTRAEYDAIEEKDPDTIYHVKEPISYDDISGKPDLKPVATTGDYNDLDNKPVIEPVYNPFITITQDGEEKGKFSLNQSNNQTIELEAGGDPHWFGTQAEYDAIPVKDPDTIYHIEGGSDDKHWFGTQAEYDAIPVKDPDMIYCIEGGGSYTPNVEIIELRNPDQGDDWKEWNVAQYQHASELRLAGKEFLFYHRESGRPCISVIVEIQFWSEGEPMHFKCIANNLLEGFTLRADGTLYYTGSMDIVSLNNKVTIKQGEKEQSFTLNQNTDVTIDLEAGGSTAWDDIQDKPEFKPVATSGNYEDLTNKPTIPSVEGLASEQYVGNELRKYLPLVGGTLTGHLTIGSTSETAYKKFEAIRKVNNEGNGAAFYVNSDGTAAFYHKSYNASGSAVNDAILKFDSVGLMFAMGGNRTTSATEFKKVLLEGDIPEHHSESWTFELEDGSTVTKNIWLD